MKLAIAQMSLGILIVASYLFMWLMPGARTGFESGWWVLAPQPHYVFITFLVAGLLLLSFGIARFVKEKR